MALLHMALLHMAHVTWDEMFLVHLYELAEILVKILARILKDNATRFHTSSTALDLMPA